MMGLRQMEDVTYSATARTVTTTTAVDTGSSCDLCGALIAGDRTEQHTAWHREIAEWLRALRDGKVDG